MEVIRYLLCRKVSVLALTVIREDARIDVELELVGQLMLRSWIVAANRLHALNVDVCFLHCES